MSTLVKEQHKSILLLVFLFFVLSYAFYNTIADNNFNIMFIAWIILFGVLVHKSSTLSIVIILFISFFGNWMEGLGFLPPQINWLVEVLILLLFLKALSRKIFKKEKLYLMGAYVVILFLIACFFSYLINRNSLIHGLLFLRLTFRYYLLFLAVINLDFNEKSMKLLNNILIFLFIIQIPTAVVKLFIYGQGEAAIGTYGTHGGGPSTVIPMIAVGFLFPFYFFYKPSKLYLFLAFSFIAFGIIGAKRAIILFVPITIVFLGWHMRHDFKNILKYAFIAGMVILLTGYISIKLLPSLNPQKKIGGEIDLYYIKNSFLEYTMRTYEGKSGGRLATTINVFNILKTKGLENLFFGLGPGSYIETRFAFLKTTLKEADKLPIYYGTTGLSWLVLQTGYTGALVYLFLFYIILMKSYRYYKSEDRPYWRSFALGITGFSFIMLIINISYYAVLIDDLISMIYFLLAGLVIKAKENLEFENL